MKKTLKIISAAIGIIGLLSTFIMGVIYFDTISEYIKQAIPIKSSENNKEITD